MKYKTLVNVLNQLMEIRQDSRGRMQIDEIEKAIGEIVVKHYPAIKEGLEIAESCIYDCNLTCKDCGCMIYGGYCRNCHTSG